MHVAQRLPRFVIDNSDRLFSLVDAIDRALDANCNVMRRDDKRIGMIDRPPLEVLWPELVFEVRGPQSVGKEIRDVIGEKRAEISLGVLALDFAHDAVERRNAGLFLVEGLVDDGIDAIGRSARFVEAFEDGVIELSLFAMVHLQLAIGIVVFLDAQDVLEEKLLRAFSEIFEL